MTRNTKPMENYNRKRGEDKRQSVLNAIDYCVEHGEISVGLVCKLAPVHRSYFTDHPDMRKVLDDAMGIVNRKLKKKKQTQDSKDALNKVLYAKISSLEKQLEKYQRDELYKEKYEKERQTVELLKKELNEANLKNGELDF